MSKTQRNVLYLIADDWSPLARCYGNPVIRTPAIDELAAQGVVFDHGFCTSPSCAVSRACILTGQHSHVHGQYGHCHGRHGFRTEEGMTSTPTVLNNAGYATALIGKCHTLPRSVYPFTFQPALDPLDVLDPHRLSDCLRTFLDQTGDRPFYAQVASFYPHRSKGGFGNERPYAGKQDFRYQPDEVAVPNFLPDLPEVREDLADYYRAIGKWDESVGAVIAALRAAGRAQDTLIVVTTDHGMPWPGAKASSFDSGHRCPFIVYHPDLKRGGITNHALMNWVDVFPTVLDWCGVQYPENALPLGGRSLLPILEDDRPQPGGGAWEQTFFSHNFHEVTNYYPYRVLRTRTHKYVLNLAHELRTPLPSDLYRSRTWQAVLKHDVTMLGQRQRAKFEYQDQEALFDLVADPAESRNLIHDPSQQHRVQQMRQTVYDWRVATRDLWLEASYQRGLHGDPGVA